MSQLFKFITGRCFYPGKPRMGFMSAFDIDAIYKIHMEVNK